MRIQLTLTPQGDGLLIPANYQYPLSAAIYKIINRADEKYSAFLHERGYQLPSGKSFKLFCFSDLKIAFRAQGDRFRLSGSPGTLIITFYIDEAAGHFVRGLFMNQELDIADKKSRVQFVITGVQVLPDDLPPGEGDCEVILQPISPLVVGRKNDRGHYDFLSPADPEFRVWLIHNWAEKYRAIHPSSSVDEIKSSIAVEVLFHPGQLKSRLITIKAFTQAETKIRGFTGFRMKVKAPKSILEVGLGAGLGLNNAMGFGCVEVGSK
jgi:CRISPR-associated endoribonuclease Cas6